MIWYLFIFISTTFYAYRDLRVIFETALVASEEALLAAGSMESGRPV